jgi:hypothetical protein
VKRVSVLVLALFAGLGCTHMEPLSVAPPGHHADVANGQRKIEISKGVAVAFTCVTAWGNRCAPAAHMDDPAIAQVYPAHLQRLEWFSAGKFEPTSFVLVGIKPGETVLRIPGEQSTRVVVSE